MTFSTAHGTGSTMNPHTQDVASTGPWTESMREAVHSMHEQWRLETGPSAAGLAEDHLSQQQQLHAGAYVAQPVAHAGMHGSTQPEAHTSEVYSTDLSGHSHASLSRRLVPFDPLRIFKQSACSTVGTLGVPIVGRHTYRLASDLGSAVSALYKPYRSMGVFALCATKSCLIRHAVSAVPGARAEDLG